MYSGSGSSDTNTSNTYYYSLGGRLLGTWDGSSPTTTFMLTDTLGSVVSSFNNLTSGAAVVLGNQVYGPYGNRRTQQGTIGTNKGFTEQYRDFVTRLDYYGAWYYDPVIGCFCRQMWCRAMGWGWIRIVMWGQIRRPRWTRRGIETGEVETKELDREEL